ncbi:uncharacterized protein KGF55_005710 [Candida pseudojiufengensis]|uniref:uncharacterized protein n=1 Tax=Candida pseudojiufengensis TaxID=497109 RepID=UPI002224D975|nr:uncharacterized protein KGF55_005710 [Candida pseudojiufengensis]KAI5958712.1 hypothetical protein KGF55_005710 [Candida pseudojiufengensis]
MYNEAHRVLLTYIRSIKSISQQDLLDAFVLICQKLPNVENQQPTLNLLNQYISDINLEISQQGFKIERKNDEIDGILYYIFINTIVDDLMKENTAYNISELISIKSIIEEIIESSTDNFLFSANKSTILQLISNHSKKSTADSDLFLMKLVDDGWFQITFNDDVILSIRGLCELKQYLIDGFGYLQDGGKLLNCKLCNEFVTMGFFNPETEEAFHKKCYEVYCRNNDLPNHHSSLKRVGPDPSSL